MKLRFPKDGGKAGDAFEMHGRKFEVTAFEYPGDGLGVIVLYRRLTWWRKVWRKLWR